MEYLSSLHGTCERVGSTYTTDVLLLTPADRQEILENKLLKKCKVDVKENTHQLTEGDVVLITSFFQPSYEKPMLKEQTSPMANFINLKSKVTKEANK